jgi:TonB family protein
MLTKRIALLTLPLTLALSAAAPASQVSALIPLTPHTAVATLGSPACSHPYAPAQATATFFQYPAISMLQGREGVADVGIELSPSGSLVKAWPVESSGDPNLDRAAMETARASRYSPERANCAAVGGSYLMEVDFAL